MKNFCIYTIDAVDVDRYFVDVLELREAPLLILIDQSNGAAQYKAKGRFSNANVVCCAWWSVDRLCQILSEHKIELVLINGHRISDVHAILAARRLGCPVSYLQQGSHIPFMKRSPAFFLRKLVKTAQYLCYALDCAWQLRSLKAFSYLIRIHVFGLPRNVLDGYPAIFPDRAAVFSTYWRQWHHNHYRFPQRIMFETGTPDLKKFKFSEKYPANTVAYCYQTLLEDGRVSREVMFGFYERMLDWAKKNRLTIVLKAHPRGASENFAWFSARGIPIEHRSVPDTEVVIGHYSSLLAYWGMNGRKVFCVELPGHKIPDSLASWALVVSDLSEIDLNLRVNVDDCRSKFGLPVDRDDLLRGLCLA